MPDSGPLRDFGAKGLFCPFGARYGVREK